MVNCIEYCNENALLSQQSITKYNNKMLCIIWWVLSNYKVGISHHFQNFSWNLSVDEPKNVAEWFRAESPSLVRCKEGDLPLLNFSNLTCMASSIFPSAHVFVIDGEFYCYKVTSGNLPLIRHNYQKIQHNWVDLSFIWRLCSINVCSYVFMCRYTE